MNSCSKRLFSFLKILADESKYKIILRLMNGEECVCTIAEALKMEQSLVSHHLTTLRDAGLVIDRKVGVWVHCSLDKKKLEKMEKVYKQVLAAKNISDKPCTSHDACKNLFERKI